MRYTALLRLWFLYDVTYSLLFFLGIIYPDLTRARETTALKQSNTHPHFILRSDPTNITSQHVNKSNVDTAAASSSRDGVPSLVSAQPHPPSSSRAGS